MGQFQSTLPHGERPPLAAGTRYRLEFQSTLPHGERPISELPYTPGQEFQSTLPHGERRGGLFQLAKVALFQSTLPHGERPNILNIFNIDRKISIHAPAWGATPALFISSPMTGDFNPRSRMGSDGISSGWSAPSLNFNPRSRMGSDNRP